MVPKVLIAEVYKIDLDAITTTSLRPELTGPGSVKFAITDAGDLLRIDMSNAAFPGGKSRFLKIHRGKIA